jgi:hypothetical protein
MADLTLMPPEAPPTENSIEKTGIFRDAISIKATPPSDIDRKRQLQSVCDDTLVAIDGERAVAPKRHESDDSYVAVLNTQLARKLALERRDINYGSLPANVGVRFLQENLELAKAEAERPRYSLRPGETREVIKTDRAGHQISEFYNAEGRCSWVHDFEPDTISVVSGGSDGIATETKGYVTFTKDHLPEIQEMKRQAEYRESAEFKVIDACAKAGLVAPEEVLAKVRR